MDVKKGAALAGLLLAAATCIVITGMWKGWWLYGTTELGVLPGGSGGMVVHQPSRDEFSSEAAWEAYQAHWRDPSWEGEHPEGDRYKLASFADGRAAGYGGNSFVAGCVGWMFLGEASDADAMAVADACGASERYLLSARRTGASGEAGALRQLLLLYFDDGADLLEGVRRVEDAADGAGQGPRGFAQLVTPDEICAYL